MDNELIKLITIIAIPTVTIVASNMALFMHLSKKIDNVSKELSEFKTETKVELVKLQARFDKYDGVNTDLEKRVAEIQAQAVQTKEQVTANQNQTNEKLLQMETDNKNYMKELTNKVIEILPKSAL